MCHSWWTTTANRILQLYIRKKIQTNTVLITPVKVKAYAPIIMVWDEVEIVVHRWKSSSLSYDSLFKILVYGTEENCWSSYTKKFIFCPFGKLADSNGKRRKTTPASSKTWACGKMQQEWDVVSVERPYFILLEGRQRLLNNGKNRGEGGQRWVSNDAVWRRNWVRERRRRASDGLWP